MTKLITEAELAGMEDRAARVVAEDHDYCGPVATMADDDVPTLIAEVRRLQGVAADQAMELSNLEYELGASKS